MNSRKFDMAALIIFVALGAALFLFRPEAQARDFGTEGNRFEIAETPIYEHIRNKLKTLEAEGRIDELNNQLQQNSLKTINRPPPVAAFAYAKEAHSFIFDPTIELSRDIRDDAGNLIAAAGTSVNPMHYTPLRRALVFIDGDNPGHVDWALGQYERRDRRVKIILVKGAPLELMKKRKVRFYFDQGGNLFRRFELARIPALIEQDGEYLKVSEVPLDEG